MALLEPLIAEPPPLTLDANGTARVGGTRVTLDTIVGAWLDGATAEEVTAAYDTLTLADVYAVLGYYLRHKAEVETYLARRATIADDVRQRVNAAVSTRDLRARLLARRQTQAHS